MDDLSLCFRKELVENMVGRNILSSKAIFQGTSGNVSLLAEKYGGKNHIVKAHTSIIIVVIVHVNPVQYPSLSLLVVSVALVVDRIQQSNSCSANLWQSTLTHKSIFLLLGVDPTREYWEESSQVGVPISNVVRSCYFFCWFVGLHTLLCSVISWPTLHEAIADCWKREGTVLCFECRV